MNNVITAHSPMWKPSSKALMGQVLRELNPDPPDVGFKYTLVDYIGLRSPWKKGIHFLEIQNHL